MIYQWPSPAKLNLFLYVIGYFTNGYHYLQTLFQLIDYGDSIKISVTNNGKIRLFIKQKNCLNHNNLILKAAKLLQGYCCKNQVGADIFLDKILPIGSGLGGASSNAATVLVVLNQQWKCFLHKSFLMKLGLILGSDIPVFIHGHSSTSEGFGANLSSIFIPKKWYLIVIPPIQISTKYIFNMYHQLNYRYSLYHPITKLLTMKFYNDFENVVKKTFPEIKLYFEYLSQYVPARLTGTGSCIFAEFDNEFFASQIQSYLPSWINSIVVRGINISPLYQKLSKYMV